MKKFQISNFRFQIKSGFTLLEILVAVSIVALVGLLIAQAFFTTTRTNTKTELLKDVKQNGDFAVEVMSRLLHTGKTVTSTCSQAGTAGTSITFTALDGGTTTLGCLVDGTVTRIASASANGTFYLTSNALTLGGTTCDGSTLRMTCTALPDQSVQVGISFTLSQKGAPPDQFETSSASFQTTVLLRNE